MGGVMRTEVVKMQSENKEIWNCLEVFIRQIKKQHVGGGYFYYNKDRKFTVNKQGDNADVSIVDICMNADKKCAFVILSINNAYTIIKATKDNVSELLAYKPSSRTDSFIVSVNNAKKELVVKIGEATLTLTF